MVGVSGWAWRVLYDIEIPLIETRCASAAPSEWTGASASRHIVYSIPYSLSGARGGGAVAAGAGLLIDGRAAGYVLGAAAIVGHVFPVWTKFRGGKGVATGAGVFIVLSPLVILALAVIWLAVSKLTKKASLASIVGIVLLPVGVGVVRQEWWEVFATIGLCLLVMARHLGNIRRLIGRQEHALT